MIVAKEFKWEAAHRLPWHNGKCKHLHGHSYKMTVELEGSTDSKGILIDFNEIKSMIDPFVNELDHTTIISSNDQELKAVFDEKSWRYYLMPFDSTAENLCAHFLKLILQNHKEILKENRIVSVAIRISETDTAYAYIKEVIS